MDLQRKLEHYRLSNDEYGKIKELLGREPKGLEWPIFSALWSEHCSYKSSRVHLGKFYSDSDRVVEGFGENAGVIDLGEGERVAFKMESHNHPSYIEPYQGAATGVGGILRDIFTMGARPIALANYLCFGDPKAERMEELVDGVVRGIGGYGNCVGVPTITGQTEFNESYDGNILVNALAVGYFGKDDPIFLSRAKGVGNKVVYVGAKTGKDGVHGASMASESFDEDSESKRPNVQIGDPFFEKCLIESCLEVMKKGLVEGIQDMGAAGLTSSSFEMAEKGDIGLTMHLDRVPVRDSSITPEEILLSESQERMLLVCLPEKLAELQKVFEKWGLDATDIGEVIEEREIQLYWEGEMLDAVDPKLVVDQAPRYEREFNTWQAKSRVAGVDELLPQVESLGSGLSQIFSDIRGCSRNWVYDQYDQRVGAKTMRDCRSSLGVVRLGESQRPLGLVLGCRPHLMRMDAQIGGYDAVAYPALQLSIKGFEPLAVTDCLNFGNPEKVQTMSEFVASIEAMSEICEKLDTPVISGNVSFYNETLGKNISSTPSTGLVGIADRETFLPSDRFVSDNQLIYLIKAPFCHVNGSVAELKGSESQCFGDFNVNTVYQMSRMLQHLVRKGKISSSRLVGKYGLAYALARMTEEGIGFTLEDPFIEGMPQPGQWFQENLYEGILVVERENSTGFEDSFYELKKELEIPTLSMSLTRIGMTGGVDLDFGSLGKMDQKHLFQEYGKTWEKTFETLA